MSSSRSSASTLPDNHSKLRGTCPTQCEVCRYAWGKLRAGTWVVRAARRAAFERRVRAGLHQVDTIPLVTSGPLCAVQPREIPRRHASRTRRRRAHVSALVQTMIRTLPVAAVLATGLVDAHARTGANAYPDPLRLLFLVNIGQPHVRLAPVAFPHGLQRGDSGLGHSLTPVWAVHCARLRPQLDRRPSIEIASVMVRRLRSRSLREPHTALSRFPSPSAPGTVPRGRRARPRFPSAGGERRHGRASPSR